MAPTRALLLLILCAPALSLPVLITSQDAGSSTVSADGSSSASRPRRCTFSWSSRGALDAAAPGAAAAAGGAPATSAEVAAAEASLSGVCITSAPFYSFTYTVCLGAGGNVTQRTTDPGMPAGWAMLLGTFAPPAAGAKPGAQKFEGGDRCGEKPRDAKVKLLCGDAAAVVRAEEPSTCSYALAVAHPALCAPALAAAFPKWDGVAAAAGGGGNGGGGGGSGAHGGAHAAALAAAPAGAPLSEEDAAGTGGRSLGVDDRLRHGSRWEGLGEVGPEEPSPWVVEAHASDVGAGRWRCVAYSADDLRKGTEGAGVGGVAVTTARLEAAGEGGRLRAVSWAARGASREALDVPPPEAAPGGALSLAWAGSGKEGGRGLAFLSVIVEDVA
jgi:hypothetical protein